jgi:hypothetical protein
MLTKQKGYEKDENSLMGGEKKIANQRQKFEKIA